MLIEFKEGVNEYANGEYHRKNDGKPFEVDKRFADEVLLPSGHFQEHVPPKPKEAEKSEPVEAKKKPAKKEKK